MYSASFLSNNTTSAGYTLVNGGTYPAGLIGSTDRQRFSMRFTISGQDPDESLAYLQAQISGTGWTPSTSTPVSFQPFNTPEGSADPPDWDPGDGLPRDLWKARQDNGTPNDWDALTGITDEDDDWYAAHHYGPGEAGSLLGADFHFARVTGRFSMGNLPGVYTLTLEAEKIDHGNPLFATWKGGSETINDGTATFIDHSATVNPSTFTITILPEPDTLVLLGLGAPVLVLIGSSRRRR